MHWKHFNSEEEAKSFSVDGRVLSGNVRKFYHEGKEPTFAKAFVRAGELMVRAFEQAAIQLDCPFEITGEYMIGKTWGDCH